MAQPHITVEVFDQGDFSPGQGIRHSQSHRHGNPITTTTNGTSRKLDPPTLPHVTGDGGSSDSESSDGADDDESVLRRAGVDIDLQALGSPSGGVAPLNLISEFVSCCVREDYRAALILCQKVLGFEPSNSTANEFLPVLQERLKLDRELPTDSSSDDSDSASDDESSGSGSDMDSHTSSSASEEDEHKLHNHF